MTDWIQSIQDQFKRIFKVIGFAFREYKKDLCDLRASALTLFSLLSIVPVMAMVFGIAKGFGFKEIVERLVFNLFAGQEVVIQRILTFSTNLLEETKGGLMALLGVLFLLYTLLKLVSHIENAFNRIWCAKDNRPLIRRFTDYIAISITAGVLVVFSSSANIFIMTHLQKYLEPVNLPGSIESWITLGFNIFPFFTVWLLFVFFYIFVPNRKIEVNAALAGGIFGGTVFQLVQVIYLKSQVWLSHYNAIYGSFAALPLFLIWLYSSWIIVLFGAEVAFSWENLERLELHKQTNFDNYSLRTKKLLVLRIVHLCVMRFVHNTDPASARDIAKEMQLPLELVLGILGHLVESRILVEAVGGEDKGHIYVPARDTENLTIYEVLSSFEMRGEAFKDIDSEIYEPFRQRLQAFDQACKGSPGEIRLKDV